MRGLSLNLGARNNFARNEIQNRWHKQFRAHAGQAVVQRLCVVLRLDGGFALAQDVDESSAEAKYNDGVLTLTLPKLTTARSKNLTIK